MKKTICRIIAALLVFIIPLNSFALSNTEKQEIVYISTDSNGKNKGVYVVNIFENKEDTNITDFGKYESIKNLTTTSPILEEDGVITVDVEKGKFFYQGNNPDREIPWEISMKYYLDGKEISPSDIAGKSGEISIDIQIMPNIKADNIYSKYYLGQFSMEIDSKKAIVKESEGATLAYNGSVQVLNYTILPEESLTVTVKVDAESFELLPSKLSAIPFNINFDLPSTTDFANQLKDLEEGIDMLNSGSVDLADGIKQIASNSNILYKSLFEMQSGILVAKNGQDSLLNGQSELHDGLIKYQEGIDTTVNNIQDMGKGLNELKKGLITIKNGSQELSKGLEEYKKGIEEYTNGVNDIYDAQNKLTSGIETIVIQGKGLNAGGSKLVEGSSKIYEGLAVLENFSGLENLTAENMEMLGELIDNTLIIWDNIESTVESIDIDSILESLINSRASLRQSIDQLENIIDILDANNLLNRAGVSDPGNDDVAKLIAEIERVRAELNVIKAELERVDSLIERYHGEQENLRNFVNAIKSNRRDLMAQLVPLKDALRNYEPEKSLKMLKEISNFRKQYKNFHDGLVEYTNGTNSLLLAIENEILPGSKKMKEGLNLLTQNSTKLNSGISRLLTGSIDLGDGVGKIIEKLNFDDINEIVKLKDAIDIIVTNHSKILDGQSELKEGFIKLSDGLEEYITGFGKFDSGVGQVNDGAEALNLGVNELYTGTRGMTDDAKKQMDDAMKAFNKEGFELRSFVDEKNTNISLVQFVYVTDSIIDIEAKAEDIEESPKTFWEKLVDIIVFWN